MDKQPGVEPDRIDIKDEAAVAEWAARLDTTRSQLQDAVAEVGSKAADVEMHLKGSRSTTNADRVDALTNAGNSESLPPSGNSDT